jgi:hypothetical protein
MRPNIQISVSKERLAVRLPVSLKPDIMELMKDNQLMIMVEQEARIV